MNVITTFDATRESLHDIVGSIRSGKTQLPDFQRGWVWDDEHIRSLLASISLAFPVGAVMMLQTGNPNVRFKPRLVEGVPSTVICEPERLILDGQQRLTSLYQSLFAGHPVTTHDSRSNPIRRWYYVDIAKAVAPNSDREDAIISLPEDRIVRNFRGEVVKDYSTIEKECAAEILPLPLVFDTTKLLEWQMKYLSAEPAKVQERLTRWNALISEVIQPFQQYNVPLIVLRKETPKEAVCQVFEKVNTKGVALTVFELLTATFAADNFNLREDWAARERRLHHYSVLRGMENTDFLQAMTLLATRARRESAITGGVPSDNAPGISCKRKDVLQLTLNDYKAWAEPLTKGFEKAAKFLYTQHFFAARDVPYQTQLVPLAATLAMLGSKAENDGVRTKLARWFWCGVFGELYGSAIESRFAKDLPEVIAWADGGSSEPSTVVDAAFAPARLHTLRTRNSAAYKGLYALLLRDGGLDFRTGEAVTVQAYFDEKIDIHHIFPKKWCLAKGLAARRYDCVVNKTPLSAKTNRIIGGNAPNVYLASVQKRAGIDTTRMDAILQTHVIDPKSLRADDFDTFFEAREQALLKRVEQAMGKPSSMTAVALPDAAEDNEEFEGDEDTEEN